MPPRMPCGALRSCQGKHENLKRAVLNQDNQEKQAMLPLRVARVPLQGDEAAASPIIRTEA